MKMMNLPIQMKLITTLLVSSLLITASITKAQEKSKQQPVLVDTIIAVVNSEVITLKELEDRLKLIERRMQREKIQMPARDVLKGQLLERMIVNRAQIQLAKESGIRVDDIILDRSVARIAEQNNLSIQNFRDQLEKDGIPFSRFREEIREEITLQRLREKEVDNKLQISESKRKAQKMKSISLIF
jgi:peptidyl-prolyl cis-trans isomerase SurA